MKGPSDDMRDVLWAGSFLLAFVIVGWGSAIGVIALNQSSARKHELRKKTMHLSPKNLTDEELWILGRKFDQERGLRAKKYGPQQDYANDGEDEEVQCLSLDRRQGSREQRSSRSANAQGRFLLLD